MFELIKTKLQDINNRINFGITNAKHSNNKLYFIEMVNIKRESERYYVEKEEFNIFYKMNIEKMKLLDKMRAKQKKVRDAIKAKKKQDKIDAVLDEDPIGYEETIKP